MWNGKKKELTYSVKDMTDHQSHPLDQLLTHTHTALT